MTTQTAKLDTARLCESLAKVVRRNPPLPETTREDVAAVLIRWWRPDPPRFDPTVAGGPPGADVRSMALDVLVDQVAAKFGRSRWFAQRYAESAKLVAETMEGGSIIAWAFGKTITPREPRETWDEVFNPEISDSLLTLLKIRRRFRNEPVGLFDLTREQGDRLADFIDDYLVLVEHNGQRLRAHVEREAEPHLRAMLGAVHLGVAPHRKAPC